MVLKYLMCSSHEHITAKKKVTIRCAICGHGLIGPYLSHLKKLSINHLAVQGRSSKSLLCQKSASSSTMVSTKWCYSTHCRENATTSLRMLWSTNNFQMDILSIPSKVPRFDSSKCLLMGYIEGAGLQRSSTTKHFAAESKHQKNAPRNCQ